MAAATTETARAYNDLVEINKMSAKGYQEAAAEVGQPALKSKLTQLSQQRAQFAADLSQSAQRLGFQPEQKSTVEGALADAAAALHRGWIDLKSAVTGKDDSAILGACESGEAAALQSYESALKLNELPAEARTVIQKQQSEILAAKNWVTEHKTSK